jgi:hypothetical protein
MVSALCPLVFASKPDFHFIFSSHSLTFRFGTVFLSVIALLVEKPSVVDRHSSFAIVLLYSIKPYPVSLWKFCLIL